MNPKTHPAYPDSFMYALTAPDRSARVVSVGRALTEEEIRWVSDKFKAGELQNVCLFWH